MTERDPRLTAFERLLAIVDRLRAEGGCPWDRKQTLGSMVTHVLEESYEVADAIVSGRRGAVAEELGDLLMTVLLSSRIAEDAGDFTIGDVATRIADKLVRRHPHVFGEAKVETVEGVLQNWEAIKRKERAEALADGTEAEGSAAETAPSALDGVPPALPALARAARLVGKAATVGFVWQDAGGALAKLDEEIGELRAVLAKRQQRGPGNVSELPQLEEELGDVAFCVAALAHQVKVDPEQAARKAAGRFEERFRRLEKDLGRPIQGASLDDLLAAWTRAKAAISGERDGSHANLPAEWRGVLRRMRRHRAAIDRRVRDLPPDRLTARPKPVAGSWSCRDVIEHLLDVEARVSRLFSTLVAKAESDGVEPFPSEGLLEPAARDLFPYQERIEGPPPLPRPDLVTASALLAALTAARIETVAAIARLARFHPRRIVASHPAFGQIDALQWGWFVHAHEARHAQQIDRILAALD